MRTKLLSYTNYPRAPITSSVKACFITAHTVRKDGTKDTFYTCKVQFKETDAPVNQSVGRRGAGVKTPWLVLFNGRWRRVYSNFETAYIGRLAEIGERLIVDFYYEV